MYHYTDILSICRGTSDLIILIFDIFQSLHKSEKIFPFLATYILKNRSMFWAHINKVFAHINDTKNNLAHIIQPFSGLFTIKVFF